MYIKFFYAYCPQMYCVSKSVFLLISKCIMDCFKMKLKCILIVMIAHCADNS